MIDISLINLLSLNVFYNIYSIPKELKYTVVFPSKNNETQCIPLLCLSSIFTAYTQSFILHKSVIEKALLKLGS